MSLMSGVSESFTFWNGKKLSVQVGRIARQASSVLVSYGKTCVLVSVTVGKDVDDSFGSGVALTVNFLAKSYAIGKIPSGFFKREGKPPEKEILTSRVIDRSIRPLLAENLLNEVNVTCSLFSYEAGCGAEVASLIGASIALMMIGAPFSGPIVGVNVGHEGDEHVFNQPTSDSSLLDLFVSSTKSSVVMLEGEAREIGEDLMYSSVVAAYENVQSIISFIEEFVKTVGINDKFCEWKFNKNSELYDLIKQEYLESFKSIYKTGYPKSERHMHVEKIYDLAVTKFTEGYEKSQVKYYLKDLESSVMREQILSENVRIDGRTNVEIRKIDVEIGVLEQVHGSALFTRGGTQVLAVPTFGTFQDEQIVDDFDGDRRESFMLHYNFLPYSVGEVGPIRAPGRREIGHGRLALKAIKSLLPPRDVFAYTIRVVSEVTESDGSSSMATVCGTSLALMHAGVPIKKAVAGIAMGLIKDGDRHVVLSDILGDEDSLGDMDFKVAGTKDGITAVQLDIKMNGIDHSYIREILQQALHGRLHILSKMNEVISVPNPELQDCVPRIISFKVPKESVQKIIGSAGKNIKSVSEQYSVKIDIDSNSTVYISGDSMATVMSAKTAVESFVDYGASSGGGSSFVPEEGKVYSGVVVNIAPYGAFVQIHHSVQGLVHISEISNVRLNSVSEVLSLNDEIKVVLKSIDSDGKLRLSMRYVDQKTGQLSPDYVPSSDSFRKDRGPRKPSSGKPGPRASFFPSSKDGGKGNSNRSGNDRDSRSGNHGKRFF